MRRAVDQMIKNNKRATFTLQLTSMVDMFTIMIVFLLKSYSTSAVNITPQKGLQLPVSTTMSAPVEALKLVVSADGIYVDDKKIVDIKDGRLDGAAVESTDPDFIRGLYDELDKHALKAKDIAEKNAEVQFDGKVVMQADAKLPYDTLKKVMYTSSLAGYADLKLATFSNE